MQKLHKRGFSKGTIFFFIGFFVISLVWFSSLLYIQSLDELTGRTTNTVGSVSMCVNKPPTLNQSCGNAVVGTLYTCDFDAVTESDQNVTFYDNSSFFNINPATGIIQFTPTSSELGTHWFNITAVDNSTCGSYNTNSTEFVLNISTETVPDVPVTPEDDQPSRSGGGGGGGVAPAVKVPSTGFSVDVNSVNVRLTVGDSQIRTIVITNIEESRLSFKITQTGFTDLLEISPSVFDLKKGESITINLKFSSSTEEDAGVHTGELVIETESSTGKKDFSKIPVILAVESPTHIFDIVLDIVPEMIQRMSGQDISAQITIFDKEKLDQRNIVVDYYIKDMNNHIVVEKSKSVEFSDQVSFVGSFSLPEDLPEGMYVFVAQILEDGSLSSASQTFNVLLPKEARIEEARDITKEYVFPYFVGVLIFLIIITIILIIIGVSHFKTIKHIKSNTLNNSGQESYIKEEEEKIGEYLSSLENYIEQMVKRGFHPDHITNHLKNHGWKDHHISKAIENLKNKRKI